MVEFLTKLLLVARSYLKSRARLEAENTVLGQRLIVLSRKSRSRAWLGNIDRLVFVSMYRLFPSILNAITVVRPETAIRWHRRGFRAYWRWKSRRRGGRPRIDREIRDRPTAPRSPWQNGHVERLIGSIRRESLDHLIVLGEAHLRDVLKTYSSYETSSLVANSLSKVEQASHPPAAESSLSP